jgi:hypothetical protein
LGRSQSGAGEKIESNKRENEGNSVLGKKKKRNIKTKNKPKNNSAKMRRYQLCIGTSAVGDKQSKDELVVVQTDDAAPLLAQLQIDFPDVPLHVRPVIGLRFVHAP